MNSCNVRLYHIFTLIFYLIIPIVAIRVKQKLYPLVVQIIVTLLAFIPVFGNKAFQY